MIYLYVNSQLCIGIFVKNAEKNFVQRLKTGSFAPRNVAKNIKRSIKCKEKENL